MRSLALFASLFGFYVLLSGEIGNSYLMSAGLVSCAFITWLSKHIGVLDEEGLPAEYWWSTVLYTPWLLWQVVLANIDVAKRVWSPSLPISPQLFNVPHDLKTGFGVATFANSITLTPGTVTVKIRDDHFEVHALTKEAADDLLAGEMLRRVKIIEAATGETSKKS